MSLNVDVDDVEEEEEEDVTQKSAPDTPEIVGTKGMRR
jgi:hypothetical protein